MPLFKTRIKVKKSADNKKEKTSAPKIKEKEIKQKPEFKETDEQIEEKEEPVKKKVVKKKKIGFRHKKKEKTLEEPVVPIEEITESEEDEEPSSEYLPVEEETIIPEEVEEKKPTPKKKKPVIKKDIIGKPVLLEDTGEKLGTVFDMIFDKDKNFIGYKIKDMKSDAVLSFPAEQFDYHKTGLIFVPGWYNNALKIIEKLEFKDKISPELTALLTEDAVSNEELYDIFVKHDDEMAGHIDDAKSLREMLTSRLKILEKQRVSLKDDLMDLTEKRLIKDIDRRKFSEDVMEHRRKVTVLDVNIGKCKDLIQRLDNTSFGVLGKNMLLSESPYTKIENNYYEKILEKNLREKAQETHEPIKEKIIVQDEYKEKYLTLKAQFEQLEDDYQELKLAVEKLVSKDEI
jgi:hypothetical protein